MAANNNEFDEDDILSQEVGTDNQSAFDSIDVFKPKLYKKELSFGKRRSFLCFSKSHTFADSSFFCVAPSTKN